MTRRHGLLAALTVMTGLASVPANAVVTSAFTASAEGWDVITALFPLSPLLSTHVPVHNPAGGNPGGYISILDPNENDTFFRAPGAYLGNMSAYHGGTLEYSLLINAPAIDYDYFDVVLQSGSTILGFAAPLPPAGWATHTVTLDAVPGWVNLDTNLAPTAGEFQAVLANLTGLFILAEYTFGLVEDVGLDSVAMSEVPEPATALVLLSAMGIGGLLRTSRRR